MSIKNFQQLDIACKNGNQVPFFLAIQFCRTKPAQGPEHFITDQRQQLEGNIMIAGLFCVTKYPPQYGKNEHTNEN